MEGRAMPWSMLHEMRSGCCDVRFESFLAHHEELQWRIVITRRDRPEEPPITAEAADITDAARAGVEKAHSARWI
jgi:hypothetical protein